MATDAATGMRHSTHCSMKCFVQGKAGCGENTHCVPEKGIIAGSVIGQAALTTHVVPQKGIVAGCIIGQTSGGAVNKTVHAHQSGEPAKVRQQIATAYPLAEANKRNTWAHDRTTACWNSAQGRAGRCHGQSYE